MSEEAAHDSAGGGGGHEEEEHGNHEAWVIPYADMLTLLMALFLVLYAMSQLDLRKFNEFAEGLNQSLGGGGSSMVDPLGGDASGVFEGGSSVAPAVAPDVPQAGGKGDGGGGGTGRRGDEERALVEVEASIRRAARRGGFARELTVDRDERGLVVAFGADRLLFAPGSDQLGRTGRRALHVFADAVADLPNPITVEGHTDSTPISTARFPSNWELSTARATAVLRYLDVAGLPAARLSAAGYADQRPRAEGDTVEERQANRRVELIVHAESKVDVPEKLVVSPDVNPMAQ